MTYTTLFQGMLTLTPPLEPSHRLYLEAFAGTRRVRRDAAFTAARPDPVRAAAGLPVGEEGAYFVGAGGMLGQEGGGELFDPGGVTARELGIVDFNTPPLGQPHLWCCWQVTQGGGGLHVPEAGGHPEPLGWLRYLLANFLGPWGYRLGGEVTYRGADPQDRGRILLQDSAPAAVPDHGRGPLSEGWSARERGEALFAQQRWAEAVAEFQRTAERAPDWPDSWWLLGTALGRLGRHDECVASLDEAIAREDDPSKREDRRSRLHSLLVQAGLGEQGLERGRRLRAQSRFDEALLEYRAHLEALPADETFGDTWVSAKIGTGLCEQGAGRYDRARKAYFEAGQGAPENPTGWTYLGYLQVYQLAQPREAITSFQLAITAGNDGSPIYNELGMACGLCGLHQDARDAFIEATHADPDDPLPWFNLGHAFLALAAPDEALDCFERAASYQDPRCHAAALEGITEARTRGASVRGREDDRP